MEFSKERARLAAERRAAIRRRRLVAIGVILALGAGVAYGAVTIGGGGTTSTATVASPSGSTAPAPTPSTEATATAPPTTTARTAPSGPPITIGWSGDTVPASDQVGLPSDPRDLLGQVAGILSGPDLMFGNLEGTLTKRGPSKCGAGSSNCFAFRSPPAYARNLKRAGFDIMNLANNHAMDYGTVGRSDTVAALAGQGIGHTGGPTEIDVIEAKGVKVAFVGFSSYTWSAPLNDHVAARGLVKKAAAQADLVVVALHGGAEGSGTQHVPHGQENFLGENRGDLRKFSRAVIDAGADLVVGSGPHVVRGMEFYKGHLIAYSAGNFVGYQVFALGGVLSESCVVEATLKPDGTWVSGKVVATQLVGDGFAAPDPSGAAIAAIRSLSRADFGKNAPRIADSGSIAPPA